MPVSIQITSEFSSDEKLKQLTHKLQVAGIASHNLIVVWNHLAKKVLRSGQFYLRAPKIKELSTVVEIDERIFANPVFVYMEHLEMIKRTEVEAPVSVLGEQDFENFWAMYPTRNGKKIGKPVAKRRFFNFIRTREEFQQLLDATANYSKACGGYPKDAERFLKESFWKEYLSDKEDNNTINTGDIDAMLNA